MMHNELALRSKAEIDAGFARIWQVMHDGIERGMNTEGVLPGPLIVLRRAVALRRQLVSSDNISNDPMNVIDWINMYALAVSEENAAGGRVVTAPTNGACGIIPAVLYYDKFRRPVMSGQLPAIFWQPGQLARCIKRTPPSLARSRLSGEIGVACSMAAAGLTELLGGSPAQVCKCGGNRDGA